MIICPNKNLPEWLELERVVPDMAYKIWNDNNGYGIDKAPNGEPSVLFNSLLDYYKGDRNLAIIAKSKVYSTEFKQWFGDWLSENKTDASKVVDLNGEPLIVWHGSPAIFDTFSTEDDSVYAKKIEELYEDTADGSRLSTLGEPTDNTFSSTTVVLNLMDMGYMPSELTSIAKQLMGTDLKVVIAEDLGDSYMLYNGKTKTIAISRYALQNGTKAQFARAFLHELVHAYTVGQYEADTKFTKVIDDAFAKAKKKLHNSKRYALTSPQEFISEIMTNGEFRNELLHADLNLFQKIWKAICSLFGVNYNPNAKLVSGVEAAIIDVIQDQNVVGTKSVYNYEIKPLPDELGEYDKKLQKVVKNLLEGLKSRLNTIERYNVRNLDSINALSRLIRNIQDIENKQAILKFVDYLHTDIKNAVDFINSDAKAMTSNQLQLLRRDYIGFYKPMINDVLNILNTTTMFEDMENYDDFVALVESLADTFNKIEQKYNNIVDRKVRLIITEESEISPTQVLALEELDSPANDITWVTELLGSIHMANSEILRIVGYKLVNSKNGVHRNTLYIGNRLKQQLEKVIKKHGLDSVDLLYEKDKDGKYTGYFIRDKLYGKMMQDLRRFKDKLAEKYKLERDPDGNYILPKGEQLKKYKRELEEWKGKYTERRFVPEYYIAKAELSEEADQAMADIQSSIGAILAKVTDDNDNVQLHKLSRTARAKYDNLVRARGNLSNPYNPDGSKKTGVEARVAEEIREFNKKVGDNIQYKKNDRKFKEMMRINKQQMTEDEYNTWYAANVELTYTEEFWDALSSLPSNRGRQTEEYNRLYEQRKQLLSLYKITSSLKIDQEAVPESVKKLIKDLDQAIADEVMYMNTGSIDGPKFKDITQIVTTDEYQTALRDALDRGNEYYEKWFEANHYIDQKGNSKPISIWTYLRPVDNKYIQYAPNRVWSEVDKSSEWYNNNFDETQPDYIQPKKKYYDNSKQYKQLKKNPELFKLYKMLIDYMQESQGKISFLRNKNKYKMPQIENTLMRQISRGNVFEALKWAIKDNVAIKSDDVDYVLKFDRTPSGEMLKHIPTHYLKELEDPNTITSDIVGAVIAFYQMADNYMTMSSLAPELELIADKVGRTSYDTGRQVLPGTETRRYKKLIQFLDMNVYGRRRQNLTINLPGGQTVDVSKLTNNFAETVRRTNLFNNLAAIATNFVTAEGNTRIEGILGRYYTSQALALADRQLLRDLLDIMPKLGNPYYDNKTLLLMDYNDVARGEQFKDLDRSSVMRTINQNFWYGGYSIGDFTVKSRMLLAMYYSHKLYNGEFISKDKFMSKYYKDNRLKGKAMWNDLDTTLYDAYEVKDRQLVVIDKYKLYITKSLENRMKNTANVLAARLDGVLNDSDRAAIHAHAIGQLLVIHRNFMIGGIQSRISKKHFNYLTQMMEEGTYMTFGRYITNSVADAKKVGIIKGFIANYQNMEDYEKYNVRKVVTELANIIAFTVLASIIIGLANDYEDGDDTFKDWVLYQTAYVAARASFEFRTLYNPFEFIQLIKSPSAGVNIIDTGSNMLKLMWIPSWFDLDHGPFSLVNRGPYEGMPKVVRNLIKITPMKNLFETSDPKNKLNYLQNNLSW